METGCGGLHVLLRAAANSCKGVADDYNAEYHFLTTPRYLAHLVHPSIRKRHLRAWRGCIWDNNAEKPISTPRLRRVRIDELAVYVVNVVIEKLVAVLEI
ncbi:hypothetical protein X777_07395 [Ooceraea biroi]|uniref:Uncharacterized protein n=1 Tax=Ooceraea biroi TaxID=2015173 RepID=A0A026WA51_OOCBI|nr:hypothetical protein X777_07395 [Ooceraea biroi]